MFKKGELEWVHNKHSHQANQGADTTRNNFKQTWERIKYLPLKIPIKSIEEIHDRRMKWDKKYENTVDLIDS